MSDPPPVRYGLRSRPLLYLVAGIAVLSLMFAGFAVLSAISTNRNNIAATVRRVEQVEQRDRNAQRATAFRLCSRDDVIRALLHWATARSPNRTNRELLSRLRERDGLPILDCTTNLQGLPAKVLPVAAQRDYVTRYINGFLNRPGRRLTREEIGVCRERIGEQLTPGHAC